MPMASRQVITPTAFDSMLFPLAATGHVERRRASFCDAFRATFFDASAPAP